jgi:hypothetical protein
MILSWPLYSSISLVRLSENLYVFEYSTQCLVLIIITDQRMRIKAPYSNEFNGQDYLG